jgi:hypothetical protein
MEWHLQNVGESPANLKEQKPLSSKTKVTLTLSLKNNSINSQ